MIKLTRINGSNFILNCDLIETIEATPDTVITTTNGKKLVVTETVEKIIEEVVKFKNNVITRNFNCEK